MVMEFELVQVGLRHQSGHSNEQMNDVTRGAKRPGAAINDYIYKAKKIPADMAG
jgi:hypothetical protein